jgi:hypothetical protein
MLFDGHKQNDSEISVRLGETFIENKNEHESVMPYFIKGFLIIEKTNKKLRFAITEKVYAFAKCV